MTTLIAFVPFVVLLLLLGMGAWYLDQQKQREQSLRESLDAARSLEQSLGRRLDEMDAYRHELAEVLQSLDIETVRAADEKCVADTHSSGDGTQD